MSGELQIRANLPCPVGLAESFMSNADVRDGHAARIKASMYTIRFCGCSEAIQG